MAELFETNLKLVSAQLPPDFRGTPAQFLQAIVERLRILSPNGTNFFVVGDIEPSTNQGPWLKGGRTWYVWDEGQSKYVPADITDSSTALFVVSESTPADPTTGDAQIWLRMKTNRVLGWFFWNGTTWRPGGNTPASGATADRPSDPGDLEQFWDTDCECLIHWERGAWRTVSGTSGDVKYVTSSLLADALTYNPGWEYLGENSQDFRGQVLGLATKDPGATPAASYSTKSGLSERAAGDTAGEESHTLLDAEIPQHTHLIGAIGSLGAGKKLHFYRVSSGDPVTPPVAPGSGPPESIDGTATSWDTKGTPLAPASVGCAIVTSTQLTAVLAPSYTVASQPANVVQPTTFLWALVKL